MSHLYRVELQSGTAWIKIHDFPGESRARRWVARHASPENVFRVVDCSRETVRLRPRFAPIPSQN